MRTTSLQDRVMIMDLAASGLSDGVIAERLGWSLATVRKWRRRGQRQGRSGLVSGMGRPTHGALSSFDVRRQSSIAELAPGASALGRRRRWSCRLARRRTWAGNVCPSGRRSPVGCSSKA